MKTLNEKYGISTRTLLKEIEPGHLAVVKKIKSRIIQKDAIKIIEIAEKIKTIDASLQISLICNDNICSKSMALLNKHCIGIIIENK
jgi:hypothetical protein